MTRGRRRDAGRERGSTALPFLAVVVIGAVLAGGAARLGSAVVARARADTAADAAALAAADMLALGRGEGAAAGAAAETASANGARLVRCSCAGLSATVDVELHVPVLAAFGGTAHGRARAVVRPECILGCADP